MKPVNSTEGFMITSIMIYILVYAVYKKMVVWLGFVLETILSVSNVCQNVKMIIG